MRKITKKMYLLTGVELTELRERVGLNQRQLAELWGVSQQWISHLESEEQVLIKDKQIIMMARKVFFQKN